MFQKQAVIQFYQTQSNRHRLQFLLLIKTTLLQRLKNESQNQFRMLYPNGLFLKLTAMVKDLKCNFYVSYEKEISLMPSYSDALVVDSKNYKKSAAEDHSKSKRHMKAYQLYLCSQTVPLEKSAKFFSSNLSNESMKDLAVMKRKFICSKE